MKDHYIISYYRKLITSFRNNFTRTYVRAGIKDIHQLRVDIKKIRVILAIAERCSRKKFRKSEHNELFSEIFAISGKVRECQINLLLAKKYDTENASGIASMLHHQIRKKTRRLEKQLNSFDFRKLNSLDRKLNSKNQELKDKKVISSSIEFILDQIKKIINSVSKGCNSKDLHSVRKRIRSITESATIIRKIDKQNFSSQNIQVLLELQEMLGNWHDLATFKKWIYSNVDMNKKNNQNDIIINILSELTVEIEHSASVICKKLTILDRMHLELILKNEEKSKS